MDIPFEKIPSNLIKRENFDISRRVMLRMAWSIIKSHVNFFDDSRKSLVIKITNISNGHQND